MLNKNNYSKVVLVGKNFGQFFKPGKGFHFDDSEKAAAWLKQHLPENSFILIKGSRSTKMEKILEALD